MDRLGFQVDETPNSGIGRRQAAPYVNGERLTRLLGLTSLPETSTEGPLFEHNIGFEPEDAFLPSRRYLEPSPEDPRPERILLLRCSCGVDDCTYVSARLDITDATVHWRDIDLTPGGGPVGAQFTPVKDLSFSREQYEQALQGPLAG